MEFFFLIIVLAVFMLPTILMMRSQRKRQAEISALQASLAPGDSVVTASGIHATIVSADGETLAAEIAPGTVVRIERAVIVRRNEPAPHDVA
ncbi:preprotein translocase subunit YajC [Corynebacterium liangguodongii]|uniref:Preprotein translocase subunit YajC n=1 Tax=Corynebacterium liangguodongii TaxID=2079535 RepID=A0A2S0WEC6_9CORY|nr:preprotein translocase subunit YajC [Corynebacterium liangguodongii]AWB84121.1 preprotein translocase subunit YajC [Corynebacterium liangguodongii]PWC00132.1 preprotein translocase subunit YajC [Corynebacterium liangguodongii]